MDSGIIINKFTYDLEFANYYCGSYYTPFLSTGVGAGFNITSNFSIYGICNLDFIFYENPLYISINPGIRVEARF